MAFLIELVAKSSVYGRYLKSLNGQITNMPKNCAKNRV